MIWDASAVRAMGMVGQARLSWQPATRAAMARTGVPAIVRARIARLPAAEVEFAVHMPVATVDDVVTVLGIESCLVVKSLVLETRSGESVLASVVGCDLLDSSKCEQLLGEPTRILPAARLKAATAIPRGALSPLAWDGGRSLMDRRLALQPLLHTGAGVNTVSLRVGSSILSSLPNVRFGDLREEPL